jgi:predicted phage-related endonuclease
MSDTIIIDAAAMEMKFGADKEPGEQGSVEWLLARVGFCTASRFKDVMDFTKKGDPGAKRKAYAWELVCERLTGNAAEHFASVAMQHGTEFEPQARMEYEARTGAMVEQVGFLHHPTIALCGGSPDGLVDEDGGLEIKCPYNSANHLQCFLTGMPEEHIPQVQGLMWITGRQWWDFVSYDPRMPDHLKLYQSRIERDDEYIATLEKAVREFLAGVHERHEALK